MKKSSLGLLLIAAMTSNCGVQEKPKSAALTPPVQEKSLRTTPAGAVGKTNFILSNGKLGEITGKFAFTADKTSAYLWQPPNIMTLECAPADVKYSVQWITLDTDGKELETQNLNDPTQEKVMADKSVNYLLRVKLTNTAKCERVSFSFNMFETDGFKPAPVPSALAVTPKGADPMMNTLQTKYAKVPAYTQDFELVPQEAKAFVLKSQPLDATPCDPKKGTVEFYWLSTDANGKVDAKQLNPLAPDAPVSPAQAVITEPGKTHDLRVRVSNVGDCQKAAVNFIMQETDMPSPSPSPSPSASPSASPAAH